MSNQISNGNCPEYTNIPIKGFKIQGLEVSLDPDSLPGANGVAPGPDNTHLVSRGGQLAWDPVAPGGDGVNYSFEEQWTGKLWVDGKKIYQKTVSIEGFPNNSQRTYPHGIEGMEDLVSCSGVMKTKLHGFFPLPRASGANYPIQLSVDTSSVLIVTFTSSSDQEYPQATALITIQYTCTDR